jgi:protein TonB
MSRRKFLIGASIAGHAALFAGVFVHGVWEMEQLGREARARTSLAVMVPPADGGGFAVPEQRLERQQRKEPPKKVVKEPRQPRPRPDEPKFAPDTGPADRGGGLGPDGPGGGDGPPGGDPCTEPGGCPPAVAPQLPPEVPRLPAPPAPPAPQTVAPQVLKGLRTSGETAIYPPGEVVQQMHRSGDLKTSASLKVCIGADGAVAAIGLLRSTRYPAYDEALLASARRWVYRPYTVNGRAVPVCSVVTFQYEMK